MRYPRYNKIAYFASDIEPNRRVLGRNRNGLAWANTYRAHLLARKYRGTNKMSRG